MTPPAPVIRRIGFAIVVVYVVVAALTLRGSGHLRPLFEGIGPSAPYQWVKPPPEFAASNTKPAPTTTDIDLGAAGTPLRGASSSDGQFVLNLPEGAIAPHPEDTKVAVTITPLDAATLGSLPDDLHPNGNAYRVEAVYQPSGQAVDRIDKAGNVIIQMPQPVNALLYSGDDRIWERVAVNAEGSPSTGGAQFDRLGYYLGAAPASTAAPPQGAASNGGVIAVVVVVVVLALAFGLGPVVYRRVRPRPAASSARRPPNRSGSTAQRRSPKRKKKNKYKRRR